MLDAGDMKKLLQELSPEIPWAHHFEVSGVHTISPDKDEKFFKKATGLKELGHLALRLANAYSTGNSIAGKSVLDIASGEGGHSIAFAQAGAGKVLGVEGRDLYFRRATAIARAMDVTNATFRLGDVRHLTPADTGQFDITLCFGILHHLGQDDFSAFLKSMGALTNDMMILYTHVASEKVARDYALKGPVSLENGYKGWLFREHADGASDKEKINQVRASLDNTFSFWADNESLVKALKKSGFKSVMKVYEPHVFGGMDNRDFRQVVIAKKHV